MFGFYYISLQLIIFVTFILSLDLFCMTSEVLALTKANFDKEIKNGYVLVDFWAPWCGPCRMMKPMLDELAQDASLSKIKFCTVNVDEESDIAVKFRITSIPHFILFKDGAAHANKVGGSSKQQFKEWLESSTK